MRLSSIDPVHSAAPAARPSDATTVRVVHTYSADRSRAAGPTRAGRRHLVDRGRVVIVDQRYTRRIQGPRPEFELPISLDDVRAAMRRLDGVANRTPVLTSRELDRRLGATVFLKAEQFQRSGAFKFRGAYNKVASLSERELARGVVASSSGNHAQALTLAASIVGARATIFMPRDAPASKRAATEGYGARVIGFDRYDDDRDALVAALVQRDGLTEVHPFDDPLVMAGAGTSTLELLDTAGPLDLIVMPTGGGGQLSGGAVAAGGGADPPRMIGVEPAAIGQFAAAIAAGRPTHVEVRPTIADGLQISAPGDLTFAVIKALADGVVGVDDHEMVARGSA